MSNWINHVKQYAKDHKVSYKEALKLASPSYKAKKQNGKGLHISGGGLKRAGDK